VIVGAFALVAMVCLAPFFCPSCDDPPLSADTPDAGRIDLGSPRNLVDHRADVWGDWDTQPIPGWTDGWSQVAWAPTCPIFEPRTPEALARVPPLRWIPCVSGRTGCQQLVTDWASRKYGYVYEVTGSHAASGAARLVFSRDYAAWYRELVVWDEDRGIVAAWRQQGPQCLLIPADITGTQLVVTLAERSAPDRVIGYRQLVGDPSTLIGREHATYAWQEAPTISLMSVSLASADVVTMYFGEPNVMNIRIRATGMIEPLWADGKPAVVYPWHHVAGRSVFFSSGDVIRAFSLDDGLGLRDLIRKTGVAAHDVATDGTTLAWIESAGTNPTTGFFASADLYASPIAVRPEALAPRRLTSLQCANDVCGVRVSDGHVVVFDFVPRTEVGERDVIVRLSDGARWDVAPVPPRDGYFEAWMVQGFVLNGELWQPWRGVTTNGQTGIQRIALRALSD